MYVSKNLLNLDCKDSSIRFDICKIKGHLGRVSPSHFLQNVLIEISCVCFKNTWVKHATRQKAVSLRTASPSNLDNMVNNSSNFNTKYADSRCSFAFITRLVDTINAVIFTKKQFLFLRQFSLP